MATRSFLALQTPEGFRGIYCHFDGYLEGVGQTLQQHYTDPVKIAGLIQLGDMSMLGETEESSVFYGRDFGETGTGPVSEPTLQAIMDRARKSGCEYFYLFADGQWSYAKRGGQLFGADASVPFSELKPLRAAVR